MKEKSLRQYIAFTNVKFIVFWSKNPNPLIPFLGKLSETEQEEIKRQLDHGKAILQTQAQLDGYIRLKTTRAPQTSTSC